MDHGKMTLCNPGNIAPSYSRLRQSKVKCVHRQGCDQQTWRDVLQLVLANLQARLHFQITPLCLADVVRINFLMLDIAHGLRLGRITDSEHILQRADLQVEFWA